MIDTKALKNKILDLAISGKLTEQLPEDGNAEDLYAQIQEEKAKLIAEGKIKKEKPLPPVNENEIPFEIPNNWKWVFLGDIFQHNTGKALNGSDNEGKLLSYITTSNLYWDRFELNNLKKMYFSEKEIEKCTVVKGDLLVCEGGDIGRSAIWPYEYDIRIQNHIHRLRSYIKDINNRFYYYLLRLYKYNNMISGVGIGLQGFSSNRVHNLIVPLPPLAEQERIVEAVENAFAVIDKLDKAQEDYKEDQEVLRKKVIDAGIQGKLTEQLPEDGTAEELYIQIQEERKTQEKEGIIKNTDLLPDVPKTDNLFTIPESWKWTSLGNISYIVRGGSPRPIKKYITDSDDGINWIKIGDVEKGGKYIMNTKEKIIPEGEKKSRKVYPGDFLLTNSMSFGRPYISQIEGCIHDGWLLIHGLNGFDSDYMYYLLSSHYMYNQFTKKASGSTVENLNIDKVKEAIVPLPPLAEQNRIAEKIETILRCIS